MSVICSESVSPIAKGENTLIIGQFITSLDNGGAETLVGDISISLKERDIEPIVFSFGNKWIKEDCDKLGIQHVSIPKCISKYKSLRKLPIFAWKFSRFLKKYDVDILHSHLYGATALGMFCPLFGIPTVATQHDIYTIQDTPSSARVIKLAGMLGTRIVTISKDMQSLYSFHGIKSELIYNGTDIGRFSPAQQRNGDITFISVGRLEKVKNFPALIKAFSMMKAKNAKLLVVGDGIERNALEAMVEDYGIKDRVKFLGNRKDIPALLSQSNAFVLTSCSEGLSCSIIEAMASRLPVVATDVGGNNELVTHGLNGFLAKSDDPVDISNWLDQISFIPIEMREIMGYNAYQHAREKFSLTKMISSYLSIY